MPQKLALICSLLALGVSPALGEGDFIDSSALHAAGLVKYWQLPLPLQPGQELGFSYLVDDQVYAATRDGYVYAIDAQTGAIRWVKQVTTAGYPIRQPCHAGSQTVFVTPPAFFQYDRYSGQPIRGVETRFPTGSAAVSDGLRFYIGGIDQRIYAFFLDQDFEDWKARATGQIVSQPALLDRYLYFAGDDGSVYACVAADKQYYWRARRVGSITADLAASNNGIYVASRDHSLYALSPQDGGVLWRTRFSGPLYEPPVLTPEVVFQYCPDDGLAAVNAGTVGVEERVRWTLPRGRKLLTTDEKWAYLLARDESILVAKLDDGNIVHDIPAAGFTMPMPSPGVAALYLASKDGRIFCARKRGVPIVLAEEVRRASLGPAGAGEESEATAEAAGAKAAEEDPLKSKRPGPPIGGKSKVSKEYTGD
ncbi:MAG: PQQ-binding-like beta-propeller repeat protein [Planctomycetes bacterium]|nr:PQQ-binding-like beta-propeller repeat protein [Planctomycetota bacterium]